MATEARLTVPADQFPLGAIFEQLPEVTVELERIIPARDVVIPYFWVRGRRVEDMASAYPDHPGIADIGFVDSVENEYLLRVEWTLDYTDVLSILAQTDVSLIEAVGTKDRWRFELRAESRDELAAFRSRCLDNEIPITVEEIRALSPQESSTETVLTDAQQEALALAYKRGYFRTPREVTLRELGEELGISDQAVSTRLRRGIEGIVAETVLTIPDSSAGPKGG